MVAADDRIPVGQAAERLLVALRPYLQARQQHVVEALIAHHRAETLTEGVARSGIAALSELAQLLSDLDRDLRLGRKDEQERQNHRGP